MSGKTRLELDLEHRERNRTSAGVKFLVMLLAISLVLAGLYIFRLQQELSLKELEAAEMHPDFNREKIELLRQIKQLQAACARSEGEMD